eukprot:Seg1893.5 transcript_id=Seg1893.5/GoldUCD/mRNA.D3Y31 product="hypothetical protein" protein_id=Seg1893.5/GoldUCD/D3Y31
MLRTNHRSLSTEQLTSFSRLAAYECKIPKTRKPSRELFRRYGVAQARTTPCEHFFIPPKETLLSWKSQLQRARNLSTGFFYIESDFGLYDLWITNAAEQLHKAREIRKSVKEELDWFSETCRVPNVVDSVPSRPTLNSFRSKIHNRPYNVEIASLRMTPSELAQVCGKRFMSSDHMRWLVNKLNVQQQEMFCVYANSLFHVEAVNRFLEDNSTPKRIGVIFNVYKKRSVEHGVEKWDVVVTREFGNTGSHFSIAVLDKERNEITYGDSLGWSPPQHLISEMRKVYEALFKERMPEMHVKESHDSSASQHGHLCSSRCSLHFPLQNDGNICGVVAAVMLAVACLLPEFFQRIFSFKRRPIDTKSKMFLANPTKYDKYLRQVLMAWMTEDNVSMKYLVSSDVLAGNSPLDPTHIMEEPEDHSDIILVEFDSEEFDLDTEFDERNIPMTAASNQECTSNKKPMRKNKPARKKATSVESGKARNEGEASKCKRSNAHTCPFSTNRRGNLRRHVQRKHGNASSQVQLRAVAVSVWRCGIDVS